MLTHKQQVRTCCPARSRSLCVAVRSMLPSFRPSLDPLLSSRPASYQSGNVHAVHSQEEVDALLKEHAQRLTVVMCKSSHCKPCKAFAKKYAAFAQHCKDTVFLEVTGDENPGTKKMMVQWAVKVTPTFRYYRSGEFLGVSTGTKVPTLTAALKERLIEGEKTPDDLVLPEEETH